MTMQRKNKILLFSTFLIGIVVSTILAIFVSNYIIPSSVVVTSAPGIAVFNSADEQITTLAFGDVQRGMAKDFQIKVKNIAGEIPLYIIDSSLVHDLPTTVGSLTWDFALKYGGSYLPYRMDPRGGTGPGDGLITLHLAISPTAPEGLASFIITINAYDSATG